MVTLGELALLRGPHKAIAGCSWGGGTGAACHPSWLLFKVRQVPSEQCSARKVFYFPSGQRGLLFLVQKSRGEVRKRPHAMSSDTDIGKNTVVGVNNTASPC